MEKRVMCYLLGRAYTSPTLQVVIPSPTWLEPICVGLTANPTELSLHIQFLGLDVRMGDSLQHIASFLARSSSTRALHILSSNALVGHGSSIAQAVRNFNLHMLDISYVGSHSRNARSLTETGTVNESGDRIQSDHIAEALIDNTSIKVLRVKAVSSILNSFVLRNPTAANQHVRDLTLVFVENVDLPELMMFKVYDILSTNQTLKKIQLLNAHFSQSMWMRIVDSLKTNTTLEVFDIGSSTGWIDKAVLSALLNLVRTHCTQIIDFGFNDLPEYFVRDNDILREALPAPNEQLRLNTEYGQVLKNAPRGPPRSARIVFC